MILPSLITALVLKPRTAKKFFSIFQRLVGKNEYQGMGIGLARCKKIVERHGGTITARGVPDQGAEFVILLPANEAVSGPATAL